MKDRQTFYIERELAAALEHFCQQHRLTRSAAIGAALREYLSPDSADIREAAVTQRLDRLSNQFGKLEQDVMILTETLAIYVRYYLSVVSPIPEAHQEAARAQGKLRFQQFTDQLVRHLQRGGSLALDLHNELYPEHGPYARAAARDVEPSPLEPGDD